jgi:hypothetical protein
MNKDRKDVLSATPSTSIQGFKRDNSKRVKTKNGLISSFLINKTKKGITSEKGGSNHG